MAGTSHSYAVVMGDLVGSERTLATASLHTRFNEAVEKQNRDYEHLLSSPLTITLGDEFQGLGTSLTAMLSLIRDFRLQLMAHDIECRFAIGHVELQTPLNTDKAWNMMGPGLARTREKLNEKRSGSLYRFAVTDDPLVETTLEALGAGLTSIERRWTGRQREDIAELLRGATAADIAKRRNVSVHTVYKVRSSGEFDTYVVQWHAIQETLARLDAQRGMN